MEGTPNPSDKKGPEVADESKKGKLEPWHSILQSQRSFHNDLECIGEMVDLVLPVLKNRDQERDKRIKELSDEVETERGKGRILKSGSDIREVLEHVNKMRRGDRMFRQGIVTSIVSKFDEFIVRMLKISYKANPDWLKSSDKKISYRELLDISSLDSLKDEIITKEIDSLMRDSHLNQLTFLDGKLKLGIEKEFPSWSEFLEITERRNLFVHTGGRTSTQYLENCSKWKIRPEADVKEGKILSASDSYIRNTIDCFYELSVRVAQASMRRIFPNSFEDADRVLINDSVDLLSQERWVLGERIFTFARNIPEDMTSGGETKYYFLINYCIAKKFSGKDFSKDLHSVDWRPFHPMYQFAIAVLEDRFEDAVSLMKSQVLKERVNENSLKQWPLLREFRKSDKFLEAYKDIYGKDFHEQLLVDAAKEIEAQQKSSGNADSPEAN